MQSLGTNRFSPGPWTFEVELYGIDIVRHISSSECAVIGEVHLTGELDSERVHRLIGINDLPNARLIAAAPELYEALELAVQCCNCSLKERDSGHLVGCFALKAIEVLAKVRGESQ